MSKLLKSKFFLGVMIVTVMVVGFAAFGGASSASADCSITSTLRMGSTGAQVVCLQTALGGLTPDGVFGAKTKAAVMVWQSHENLVADGIFGPMSNAAWVANQMTGSFPAGCNSAVGFSSTTGMPCNAAPAPTGFTPAGCTSASGFSPVTGGACQAASGLPAGCTSTSGFSPTTGLSCSGGSSSSGPITGGAGDISLTAKSTYSSENVVAGDEDVKIMAFEVEADDGSDVDVTSVKVEFINTNGASSNDLDDYAESVSIWMGSEKVGESDVSDFSESSNYWSDSISLDGAVIDAGETEVFTVAVTALNNLDSGDIDTDAWEVDLLNVRFTDGEGVTTTETADVAGDDAAGTFDRTFDFDDLATSGDLELNLSTSTASPDAGSVEVDTVTTTDVTMLEFKLKAEGSDMVIDAMELTGTATDGTANTWADMVSELSLEAAGDEIDSISAYGDAVDDNSGDLWFTDLNLEIAEGDTVTFKVIAKIRAIAATTAVASVFDQGDTFLVSFTSANFATDTTNTDVEDGNGDLVATTDRTGSAIGEVQTFYSSGMAVDMGSVTYESVTDSGNVTQVTYTIPLSITSFGDTRYIGLSVEEDDDGATITDGKAISYAFQKSSAPASDVDEGTTTAVEAWSCDATIESSTGYRLDEGDAVNCTLTVTLSGTGATPGSYRVHVEGVETWTDAALSAGGVTQQLTPVEDFETAFKLLNS